MKSKIQAASKNQKELKEASEKNTSEEKEEFEEENEEEEEEEEEADEDEEEEDLGGGDTMLQVNKYSQHVQANMAKARETYTSMTIIESDNFLSGFFRSNKGRFVNYEKIEEEERLKYMVVALNLFRQNMWSIDYIKRKIYVVQCPEVPDYKRSIDEMTDISMETITKLEEIMELFSIFYLEVVDQIPKKMHRAVDLTGSEKLLLGQDVFDKLKKKSQKANLLFDELNSNYGNVFLKMGNTECDVKDYMSFFHLLPRFLYVYKNLREIFETYPDIHDPYIKYSVKMLKNMTYDWKLRMNSTFKSMQFINFFIIFTKMLFELVAVSKDPVEIIKPLEVFMDLYNMSNFTFAEISKRRKEFLEDYEKLKKMFILMENYRGLNSMPFPVFGKHVELFDSTHIFKIGMILWIMVGWLLIND